MTVLEEIFIFFEAVALLKSLHIVVNYFCKIMNLHFKIPARNALIVAASIANLLQHPGVPH